MSYNEPPFSITTLKNGIRLIHQNTGKSEIVHCGILVNAGTRHESHGKEGLAHFIEHVLFKGTSHRTSMQILNRLEVVGGELNAYTSKEETCIHASVQVQYLERAFDLIADIMFNSIFPEKEIAKEKEVVLDEIRSYLDNPSEQIFEDFESKLFRNNTLGNPILGTTQSVKAFTRNDIINFIKTNYHPEKMVVSVTGDISFTRAKELADKYFVSRAKANNVAAVQKFKHNKTFAQTMERPTEQTHFVMGNVAYSFRDKRRLQLSLLNNILGGPAMNSILSLSVREKYGYTYNIESNYLSYSDTGVFNIYFATEPKLFDKTYAVVNKELEKLRNNKFTTTKLSQHKKQLIGQIALAQENKAGIMMALGRTLLNHNRVDTLETIFAKINAITPEDILHVANEVFDKNKFSTLQYVSPN
nr:insulinase family protein [Bacteroidota bacterium]